MRNIEKYFIFTLFHHIPMFPYNWSIVWDGPPLWSFFAQKCAITWYLPLSTKKKIFWPFFGLFCLIFGRFMLKIMINWHNIQKLGKIISILYLELHVLGIGRKSKEGREGKERNGKERNGEGMQEWRKEGTQEAQGSKVRKRRRWEPTKGTRRFNKVALRAESVASIRFRPM